LETVPVRDIGVVVLFSHNTDNGGIGIPPVVAVRAATFLDGQGDFLVFPVPLRGGDLNVAGQHLAGTVE
jgi:hypothetical protein